MLLLTFGLAGGTLPPPAPPAGGLAGGTLGAAGFELESRFDVEGGEYQSSRDQTWSGSRGRIDIIFDGVVVELGVDGHRGVRTFSAGLPGRTNGAGAGWELTTGAALPPPT